MKNCDFNDIHSELGIDEVRRQLHAGLEEVIDPPAPPVDVDAVTPPAPSTNDAPGDLAGLLARFWLILPEDKVFDSFRKQILKKTGFRSLAGKDAYAEWQNSEAKRVTTMAEVKPAAASAAKQGGGELAEALERYVYLYPTSDAWDARDRTVVAIGSLRYAIANCFDEWLKHPLRKQIKMENLVFDPSQQSYPDTHINKFRGLPLEPKRDDAKCQHIIQLITHLCNGDAQDIMWITRWMAYPLQNVGAKMATAVMVNSPTEGTGKSLLFDGVYKRLFGEYGTTAGQHQLESQYTDWVSGKLFAVFEEVLTREQKGQFTGLIKHLITGATIQISKKFVSSWEERNHINMVFLSNEMLPWYLDESDRRMQAIYPESTLPPGMQAAVNNELNNGGLEAFYAYLLAYPLDDFGPHTKPIANEAKRNLIEMSRASWDGFVNDWLDGKLEIKPMPCRGEDLFAYYSLWGSKRRENVVGERRFLQFIRKVKRLRKLVDTHVDLGYEAKKMNLYVPVDCRPGEGVSQKQWLGRSVEDFKSALAELR